MKGTLDHVMWSWDDLDVITNIFSRVGLDPDYGGTHQDSPTEMAMLGFEDGTYLELIAPSDQNELPEEWPASMASAGPCRWAIRTDDLAATIQRLNNAGARVWGPFESSRKRPDGTTVRYEEAVYGVEDTLWRFPFLITDLTPREHRVKQSDSVTGGSLTGIAEVVIAVGDTDAATEQFQRLHGYPSPKRTVHESFGARLASFPGQSVTLAEPLDGSNWLAQRLRRHQEGPCTVLIGSANLSTSETTYQLSGPMEWLDATIRWLDAPELRKRLGLIER